MFENPFLKQGKMWEPPSNVSNPYRPAKIIKPVTETKPNPVPFPTKSFNPVNRGNPYRNATRR